MELSASRIRTAALIIFVGDVIALIVVLFILWQMQKPQMNVECGYMCLPCADVQTKMCCGCRDEILLKFMNQTFEDTYQVVSSDYNQMFTASSVEHRNDTTANYKPMAHLVGEDRDMPGNDGKAMLPLKKWQKGKNCLLMNGVSFHRGRFRVPVSGFYHVYSGIDFSYQYTKGNDSSLLVPSKNHMMIHAIYRSNLKNTGTQEEVVCTHHPYEMSRNLLFARYDTYVGGDVYLEAGDEIYVKVENISYASSPPNNVFGLHFI